MEKKKQFHRDELKSGFVVKLRNGEYRMVMRVGQFTKVLINPSNNEWEYLNTWDDNLKRAYVTNWPYKSTAQSDPPSDIVEVYGLVQGTTAYGMALTCHTYNRKMLWKRSEPKKMTLEEISEKLGYEIEIVAAH